jgi:cobalt-zinc-cadmium resistance protein CzcA
VIESPDRSPQELHTFEDWIIGRAYRSVAGVADDSGFGGPTMQYHVLLDPSRLYGFHIPVVQVVNALQSNNANTGGGFYSQGGQFYYVRGLGLVKSTDDIGEIVVASNNGAPVRIRDIGHVEIGHAPRLGIFGFQDKTKNNDDAVEGVILMRRGEQTQNVLQGVERKTEEINKNLLPRDVRVRPYYDRSDLVRVTTGTVEGNLLRGMILVLIVLIFFLVSVRAAVITALTIPLALLFAFIFLHLTGEAANLLSIGLVANFCRISMKPHSGFALLCPTPFLLKKPPSSRPKSAKFSTNIRWSPSSALNSGAPMTAPTPPDFSTVNFM